MIPVALHNGELHFLFGQENDHHAAKAGATGPAAADLALQKQVTVFVADSHATAAAVVVVGVERAGEPGGGGAVLIVCMELGNGVGFKGGYDMGFRKYFYIVFLKIHLRFARFLLLNLALM